jgi:hypothetical protein
MASGGLKVHIPQEANPDTLIPLLNIMYEGDVVFPNVKSLLEFTYENGLGSRTELQIFASTCGLLHKSKDGIISLSKAGATVAQTKHEVKADLIHFLMYTGWEDKSRENTELWAYREVVNLLWDRATLNVLSISSLVNEEIRNKAFELFGENVSFSPKSIRGVRKWLEAVIPPVIENDNFTHRYFCPPELALMAVGWIAQQTEGELGIDFLLTPDRRKAICKVCMLHPSALDRVLDWMLPLHSEIIVAGTSAGVYGRFLRFLKWPEMSDLMQ